MPEKSLVLHGETFQLLLENEQIESRISEIGEAISTDYAGRQPVFIIVLSGAFMFAASLLKAINLPTELQFIRLNSYSGKRSRGEITETLGLDVTLRGRDLIILEDIVDSGQSMHYLLELISSEEPASVKTAVLLYKPLAGYSPAPDYVGFSVENRFVVGYGMDIDGLGRNLSDIYISTEPAQGGSGYFATHPNHKK